MTDQAEREFRFLPEGYPLWAEAIVSTVIAAVLGGVAGFLMVLLVMGGKIDAIGWIFTGAAAVLGGGVGLWSGLPSDGRIIYAALLRVVLVAGIGCSMVDRERISYKPNSLKGPVVTAFGMCILVLGGVGMTLQPLLRKPRTAWNLALAVVTAILFGIALAYAISRLWERYG